MYRKLLVPLDGSVPSEAALPFAEAVARASAGCLHLVWAAPADMQCGAVDYLADLGADLRARGLKVKTQVLDGLAADAIVEVAARDQADLIVMATHGRTGLGRSILGSVADEVLRHSSTPLLLVRPGQEATADWPRRVLVPLDGSGLAEAAIEPALAVAGRDGELVLFQAVMPEGPVILGPADHGPIWAEFVKEVEAEALGYLEAVAAAPRAAGHRVRTTDEYGVAGPCVADFARRERIDLVVLASHGRGGAARWLLGSVADDLLRESPSPLLILRPLIAAVHRPWTITDRPRTREEGPTMTTTTLELNERQEQLVRLALESLLWDTQREEHLTADLHQLLAQLPPAFAAPAAPPMAVAAPRRQAAAPDYQAIQSGYPVFAHRVDGTNHADPGQFVGVVEETIERRGLHYLRVRGAFGQARELYLPVDAIRAVVGKQVHLNLGTQDLLGQAWHMPPLPLALRAS